MSKASSKRMIQQMVDRIVEKFDPERIILFGSHARGDATRDSDVDLLVILKKFKSRRDVQVKMRMALHQFDADVDLIVTSPEQFESRRHYSGTIERPAALEGRVVYARA